ncbi:hypothetical protein K435DRAFT_865971 [Dendrothele bispora CBS 962.96]|uniref:Uncharacterized protein n=1 Tax=Dendrothele bispora (strain CBS 962.96) TaxID=1314807 RepID=A0A4S8LI60_DENBC|nr:hypothetical protein K435DRAFT_865971 [Dendrothele bispora CBS 962.96]
MATTRRLIRPIAVPSTLFLRSRAIHTVTSPLPVEPATPTPTHKSVSEERSRIREAAEEVEMVLQIAKPDPVAGTRLDTCTGARASATVQTADAAPEIPEATASATQAGRERWENVTVITRKKATSTKQIMSMKCTTGVT